MGIIAALKTAIGLKPIYSQYDLVSRQGRARPTDARSFVENHNKSWVYVCSSRNAETVTSIPLKLYARGGTASYYSRRGLTETQKSHLAQKADDEVQEITEGHPLLDLLDRVNEEMTRSELMQSTVNYLELTGDAYWYIEPGALRVPAAIWPLMSQYVRVVRAPDGSLTGYLFGKDQLSRIALDVADVIHFRYPNPKDPDYGLSPLEAAFGAATVLEAGQEYMRTMYDSGGMPEVAICVKGRIGKPERDSLYAEWKRKFASKRKGEKAIILEGEMTIQPISHPPKDVGTEFEQKFSREEIAAAFGVPLTMIQLNEASRAGAEAGMFQYLATTIVPKLRLIEEKLTEQLAARYDPRLFLAFDNPVPQDREYRLKEIKTRLDTRMTTVNEERALEGMPPVAWGDEPNAPVAPPAPFGNEPTPRGEPAKGACGHVHKTQEPLTANEKRFAEKVTDHFVKYAREVDGRIEGQK